MRWRSTGAGGARGRSSPVRSLARVAGAPGSRELVQAVEALRGVLWEALVEEIPLTPTGTGARHVGKRCIGRLKPEAESRVVGEDGQLA